ncbi:MAG: CHAT domain-containing tetratricopeptide repeat protein [Bacteroidota bacterium]
MNPVRRLVCVLFVCLFVIGGGIHLTYGQAEDSAFEYLKMGKWELMNGRYENGLDHFLQARKAYGLQGKRDSAILMMCELALNYFVMGNMDSSSHYFRLSRELAVQDLGDQHPVLGEIYDHLGEVNTHLYRFDRAEEVFEKSWEILKESPSPYWAEHFYHKGNFYRDQEMFVKAEVHYLKGLDVADSMDASPIVRANIFEGLGGIYLGGFHQFDKAIASCQKAIDELESNISTEVFPLSNLYSLLGAAYLRQGDFIKSEEAFSTGIDLGIKLKGKFSRELAAPYQNFALLQMQIGELDTGIEYFQLALNILLQVFQEEDLTVASVLANLGDAYSLQGKFDLADSYLKRAARVREMLLGKKSSALSHNYFLLGKNQFYRKEYSSALTYFYLSLGIQDALANPNLFVLEKVHLSMASIYSTLGTYDSARYHLRSAESIVEQVYPVGHDEFNTVWERWFLLNLYEKKYETALLYGQKIIASQHPDIGSQDGLFAPFPPREMMSYVWTIKGIYKKAYLYFHQYLYDGRNETALRAAKMQIDLVLAWIEFAHSKKTFNVQDLASSREWIAEYELAKDVLYQLYVLTDSAHYVEEAYHYTEQFQANLLKQSFLGAKAEALANIPSHILEEESRHQDSLTELKTQLFSLRQSSLARDSLAEFSLQSRISMEELAYKELMQQIRIAYPAYHYMKYNLATVSIPEIQTHLLDKQQALIQYSVGFYGFYAFVITPTDIGFLRLSDWEDDHPQPYDENQLLFQIRRFRKGIFDHSPATPRQASAPNQEMMIGWELYEQFVQPIEAYLSGIDRLVIVPSSYLGYLPFDLLLSSKPHEEEPFVEELYLFRKYAISYTYSTTLQAEILEDRDRVKASKQFMAWAPSFPPLPQFAEDSSIRGLYYPLSFNTREVSQIARSAGIKSMVGKSATKTSFVEAASDYRFLHLATHAQARDIESQVSTIAFSPETDSVTVSDLLTETEIYRMDLHADMVVLSACETGLGALSHSEGVMSLARAFTYAGAKSVISTLWSVNDASMAYLMDQYYQNLANGHTKDVALQQAKLTYLEEYDPRMKAPFFWAAPVAYGDMEPVDLQASRTGLWTLLGSVVILLILGIRILHFRQKRREQGMTSVSGS